MLKSLSLRFILLLICSLLCTGLSAQDFGFALLSDTHYGSENARESTRSILKEINDIEYQKLPGWRKRNCPEIKGLFHLGDILNEPNDSLYQLFLADFGLTGEGIINYPVYELFGNHDGGYQDPVRQGLINRNPLRTDISGISDNGLHYSWTWEGVKFIALNSYPGNEWDDTCGWCHYFKDSFKFPQYSLYFLEKELKALDDPKTPVVLLQHYGWDGFSLLWWTEAEQQAYYDVIKDYNILGIFHGHNHAVEKRIWKGIPVWACGSPQKDGKPGDFIIARIKRGKLKVYHRYQQAWHKIRLVSTTS